MSKDQMENNNVEEKQVENPEMTEETTVEENVEESTAETEEKIEEEVKKEPTLEEQLNEANGKFIRLYADFENYRKRTNKEKVDLLSSASAGVVKDMLTVMDDFERAIQNNQEVIDPVSLKEGFSLIYTKFKGIMESKGLKPMEAKGEPFDSEIHEAVANMPVEDDPQKGKIIDDVEKGYYLNDKVIRFAKVVVGQ
jgi:molecular chaperone GrpE